MQSEPTIQNSNQPLRSKSLEERWIAAIPIAYKIARRALKGAPDAEDLAQELLCHFPEVADSENIPRALYKIADKICANYDPLGIGLRGTSRRRHGGYPKWNSYGSIYDGVVDQNTRIWDERRDGHDCFWCGKWFESSRGATSCSPVCNQFLARYSQQADGVVAVLAALRCSEQPVAALRNITTQSLMCIRLLQKLGYSIEKRLYKGDTLYKLTKEGHPLPK